jgi:hypothetical protein
VPSLIDGWHAAGGQLPADPIGRLDQRRFSTGICCRKSRSESCGTASGNDYVELILDENLRGCHAPLWDRAASGYDKDTDGVPSKAWESRNSQDKSPWERSIIQYHR